MITDGSHPSHMDPDPAQTPSPTALQSTTQQPCAATLVTSSLASLSGVSSGRSMSLPFSNRAPARTRATRWGPLTARQRPSAACSSLNTIASPLSLVPGPLVTLVLALTGANELSIGLVVLRCTQCSAGKSKKHSSRSASPVTLTIALGQLTP